MKLQKQQQSQRDDRQKQWRLESIRGDMYEHKTPGKIQFDYNNESVIDQANGDEKGGKNQQILRVRNKQNKLWCGSEKFRNNYLKLLNFDEYGRYIQVPLPFVAHQGLYVNQKQQSQYRQNNLEGDILRMIKNDATPQEINQILQQLRYQRNKSQNQGQNNQSFGQKIVIRKKQSQLNEDNLPSQNIIYMGIYDDQIGILQRKQSIKELKTRSNENSQEKQNQTKDYQQKEFQNKSLAFDDQKDLLKVGRKNQFLHLSPDE